MKVRIVCYEGIREWILGKHASQLCDNLTDLGVVTDIAKVPDPKADVNHHIIYIDYDGKKNSLDTLMITHIDSRFKVRMLKRQLGVARMGICVSTDTMNRLARNWLPRSRLCFINPGHDGVVRPRPLVVGITSKVQPSGCKREWMIERLGSVISGEDFRFVIMGAGWDRIVESLRRRNIRVDYLDKFDREKYLEILPGFDYYLYPGRDEGSMGFIDALAAGISTITTPQGFHLDAASGIDHPFEDFGTLANIFREIARKRQARVGAVTRWTWAHYALKHKAIWEYLLLAESGGRIPAVLSRTVAEMGVVSLEEDVPEGIVRYLRGSLGI
jgi:hypothetical protein